MKTLVTGGTGMVGYNIIKVLLANKRKVRALVRSLEKGKRLLPDEVELVPGDITDINSLRPAMSGCAIVYHAAGFPEQWMKDNAIFHRVNVEGTQNMIDVALELNVQKFLYTSTIDVFAAGKGETFDEQVIDTKNKGTYYERSKQEADRRVVAALDKGLPAIFLHPSGVYGPGPTDSPGTNDFIEKLAKNQIPILLPGGYPIVYAPDVGLGHYLAEQKADIGSRYILSEHYYSLKELATYILKALGKNRTPPAVMPYPIGKLVSIAGEWVAGITNKAPLIPGGQLHFLQWQAIPLSAKAQKDLGWVPTPAGEALGKTVDYLF